MPRRKAAPRREILPDPLFHSILLAKFINTVMNHGKKSIAEKVVYGALDLVVKSVGHIGGDGEGDGGEQGGGQGSSGGGRKLASSANIRNSEEARSAALKAFRKALENVTPAVEVNHAVSGVLLIKFRLKSVKHVESLWRCAGWWILPGQRRRKA